MKHWQFVLIFASFFGLSEAAEITYLGNGRYVCGGGSCEQFNHEQAISNFKEEQERQFHNESRQDNQRIIEQLKKQNEKTGKYERDTEFKGRN